MYTKKVYKAKDMALWTRFETLLFFVYVTVLNTLYFFFELEWIRIPWTPLALIGTAVAFVIGFQNNAAYGRIWEARKIWGGIVNTSRTWGMYLQDMITNEYATEKIPDSKIQEEVRALTYRHIAWMTALRHAMRADKPWETVKHERSNQDWSTIMSPPEWQANPTDDLAPYLSEYELNDALNKDNKQTALLY